MFFNNINIFIGHIPKPKKDKGLVLGLSKLTRIVQLLASRPVLQETIFADIAEVLCFDKDFKPDFAQLETLGSGRFLCPDNK